MVTFVCKSILYVVYRDRTEPERLKSKLDQAHHPSNSFFLDEKYIMLDFLLPDIVFDKKETQSKRFAL